MDKKEFELHEASEQSILFHVQRLDYDFKWRTAETSQFKTGGRFIIYDKDFMPFLGKKEVGPTLEFKDEGMAMQMAKALARITDRPLRVERIQTVRLQRQVGKVILPVGGL
jgi:hypothetical protein